LHQFFVRIIAKKSHIVTSVFEVFLGFHIGAKLLVIDPGAAVGINRAARKRVRTTVKKRDRNIGRNYRGLF
jgi:hypothetical protein